MILLRHRLSRKGKERYHECDFYPKVKNLKIPQKVLGKEKFDHEMLRMVLGPTWNIRIDNRMGNGSGIFT